MEPEIMFSRCGVTLGVTADGIYYIDEGFGFEEIPADTEAEAVAYLENLIASNNKEA